MVVGGGYECPWTHRGEAVGERLAVRASVRLTEHDTKYIAVGKTGAVGCHHGIVHPCLSPSGIGCVGDFRDVSKLRHLLPWIVPAVLIVSVEGVCHVGRIHISSVHSRASYLVEGGYGLIVAVHADLGVGHYGGLVKAYPVAYERFLALSGGVEDKHTVIDHALLHFGVEPCQFLTGLDGAEGLHRLAAAVAVNLHAVDLGQGLSLVGLYGKGERELVLQLAERAGIGCEVGHAVGAVESGIFVKGDIVDRQIHALSRVVSMEHEIVQTVLGDVEDEGRGGVRLYPVGGEYLCLVTGHILFLAQIDREILIHHPVVVCVK